MPHTLPQGSILSINVGKPATVKRGGGTSAKANKPQPGTEKTWLTGFGKQKVTGPIRLRSRNLDGDGQADLKHHGGPDKAVCVYSIEHYPAWRDELQLDLMPGAFGENLTIVKLNESCVCIGDTWAVGDAVLQVSQPRQPCWKLSRWWGIDGLSVRVQQTGRTGWYLRVLTEGTIEAGMTIQLVERFHPEWTIEAANLIMHRDRENIRAAESLANLPQLSDSWRKTFSLRSQRRKEPSSDRRLFGITTDDKRP